MTFRSMQLLSVASLAQTHVSTMSSSDSRAQKLRRLDDFRRRVPFVSQAALAGIFQEIQQHGMPELLHRHDMVEAADFNLQQHQEYGELLPDIELVDKDGQPVGSTAVNFLSYLHAAFTQGGSYTDLMCDCMEQSQEAWNLIVYSDEIDAGDPVAPRGHTRKVWSIYFSFLEFGPMVLSQEEAWLTIRVARTVEVDNLAAGCYVLLYQPKG